MLHRDDPEVGRTQKDRGEKIATKRGKEKEKGERTQDDKARKRENPPSLHSPDIRPLKLKFNEINYYKS